MTSITIEAGDKTWQETVVRFGDIQFDYLNVQRDPIERKIKEMAHNWRRAGLVGIVVNRRRNGMLSCVDGQQRILSTIRRNGDDFYERVGLYDGLEIAEEAEMFELLNGIRTVMSAALHFRSAVVSGKALEIQIIDKLDALGIGYSYRGHGGDRSVVCFRAMQTVGKLGVEHFKDVMELINDAWDAEQIAIQAYWLRGVSMFIRRHQEDAPWKWDEVRSRFKTCPATVIDQMQKELRAIRKSIRPSAELALYEVLLDVYNKGRRESNRLELKRRG